MRTFLVTCAVVVLLWYGFALCNRVYWRDGGQRVTVTIARGADLIDVEGALVASGALSQQDAWLFDAYARATDADRRIKAGTFAIARGGAIADMLAVLATPSTSERTLTFIEGWNLRDIAAYLVREGVITTAADLYRVTGVPAHDYRRANGKPERSIEPVGAMQSKPAFVSLEGYLFPDTYRFYSNATVDEVVTALVGEFQNKLEKIDPPQGTAPGKFYKEYTFFEVLTMASILEAEVRGQQDRRMVADIMWRRLENGWPLQVDSSVNYVTDKNDPSARAKDLVIDSPFNTYKHKGLPLGPINNPGLQAIDAAVHPASNAYWFFLTGRDGAVHYARTLEEHAANRKYL